jgi:hypothetical protein
MDNKQRGPKDKYIEQSIILQFYKQNVLGVTWFINLHTFGNVYYCNYKKFTIEVAKTII